MVVPSRIAETVGIAGHDTGSFAGIGIRPYAAMPSMHVGWSVLLAIIGYRVRRMEFAYDDDGRLGKGGNVTLYVDGKKHGEGRLEETEPIGLGGEFADIGHDDLSPVYSAFNGTINWIELESGDDDHSHLLTQRWCSTSPPWRSSSANPNHTRP